MSSLEGSITLQAFGAVFFLLAAFFIDAFTEICKKNRQEYQPIYVKKRVSSAAEWLSPSFGCALVMKV